MNKELLGHNQLHSLSIAEFLNSVTPKGKRERVRLMRLKAAVKKESFPFKTVRAYLEAGSRADELLMELPGIGKVVAHEMRRLLQAADVSQDAVLALYIQNDTGDEFPSGKALAVDSAIRTSPVAELLRCKMTVRLRNSLTSAIAEDRFPFRYIGDVIDAGAQAGTAIKKIAGVGTKQVQELLSLIESIASSGHFIDSKQETSTNTTVPEAYEKNTALADHLDAQYPGVFEPLIRAYSEASAADQFTCHGLEQVMESLLANPRIADICQSRFSGETLESIGQRYDVTRERIRQIESKYAKYISDITSEDWLSRKVLDISSQHSLHTILPNNEALAAIHPKIFWAIRHAFFPKVSRTGALTAEERYTIAEKIGFDPEPELEHFTHWTQERVVREVRKFAKELGKSDLMPFQNEFRDHGRIDLRGAVQRFGGQSKVAKLAGLTYQGQQVAEDGSRTYWTEERIGTFLCDVAHKEGRPGTMPTQAECRKHAPNPVTIIAIVTRGGWYGKEMSWLEVAKKYKLKYAKDTHKVTLSFVRAFVKSLGDALYSLTPSEIYILFEQHGIAKAGKHKHQDRSFDNLVGAIQSGYLPREEIDRWVKRGEDDLVEALLDPDINSIEEAFASVGKRVRKQDHKSKVENPHDDGYQEDVERHLPTPRVIDTLSSLETATDLLVHTSSDAEAVQFLIAKAAGKLWRRCFEDEQTALDEAKQHHGNIYSESARDTFLEEYTRSKQLPIPEGYAFNDTQGIPRPPKLMQRLVAYKTLKDGRVLNLSGTGTGKTLSAVLASRVIGAHITVIACPNATVDGWHRTITSAFPQSDICGKTWEPNWSPDELPRYLVVNHEMFQNRYEGQIKRFIVENQIDFVVIDELHQVKQRDESFESQRRRLLNGLITDVPDNRPKPRVLGMSATPIVNNLQEGKSLIELVSSLQHDEIGTQTTVQNCMKVYQKFTTMGFRMMPKYRTDRIPKIYPIDCTPYLEELLSLGSRPHPQQVEAVLVRARWPIIKRCLRPKTVIFTDYVKDIVPYLFSLIQETGMSVGIYTGEEKLATELGYKDMLDQFMRGDLQVLIASIKTVGTGVDGLQYACNNIIFATLPWTNTDYEQAIGRFDREGFKYDTLDIHIPKTYAVLSDGQEWSWCDAKLARLENKRDVARAAVDGEIPDTSDMLTPEKASSYWLSWLKRLTDEGMTDIERREIRVPLDESNHVEVVRRFDTYGDFSKLNAYWNRTHSSETHRRLQGNPEEWCYYHTRMQEYEREWQIIPRVECIKHLTENLPRGSVVGDYGCGQAQLAQALHGIHTVYSLDHVALNTSVTACDMAKSPIDDSFLDAAIFSLSLMGSNSRDYITEAYRTLKLGGQLVIYHPAEHNDRAKFLAGLEDYGFATVREGQIYKWHYIWAIKRGQQRNPNTEISF